MLLHFYSHAPLKLSVEDESVRNLLSLCSFSSRLYNLVSFFLCPINSPTIKLVIMETTVTEMQMLSEKNTHPAVLRKHQRFHSGIYWCFWWTDRQTEGQRDGRYESGPTQMHRLALALGLFLSAVEDQGNSGWLNKPHILHRCLWVVPVWDEMAQLLHCYHPDWSIDMSQLHWSSSGNTECKGHLVFHLSYRCLTDVYMSTGSKRALLYLQELIYRDFTEKIWLFKVFMCVQERC